METPESAVGTMEAELKQWSSRLDDLLAKGDTARAPSRRSTIASASKTLKEKYNTAEAKLAELKAAGSGEWKTLKDGVENAWSELATAFTRVAN